MKHLFLLFLIALLPMVASAEAVEINGIYYNLVAKVKQAEVTNKPSGYYTGSVTIPESVTYGGIEYSVTAIGEKAFFYCKSLTSVTIPNSVTKIGSAAFQSCILLTSITIPNNVISIGHHAFDTCTSLTSVIIPNGVTSIEFYTFYGCTSLTSLVIPNSVTSIGQSAFYHCSGLTSITFPNVLNTLGRSSFEGCSGLTSITIPNSLNSIEPDAFKGCTGLTSLTIGSGIKYIYSGVFAACPELKDVFCLAEDVPSTSETAFNDSYIEFVTLHVPGSAISAYKAAEPWKNFKEIISLDGPGAQKCATPAITYQGGKLKMSCSTEGVEFVTDITDADIKKHYDATISLTATYNISVYATKAGYDDSDVATITLCWIDQAPAISMGVAQVPAIPVIIKCDGGLLTIEGANDNTQVNVYTMDGVQVGAAISRNGLAHIATSLSAGSLAIVKIGDKSVKVAIR